MAQGSYAYDVKMVKETLSQFKDNVYSPECQKILYQVIRRSYDEEDEERVISSLAREARLRGEDVVYMRLSRAAMVMAYLLASSKVIYVTEELRRSLEKLVDLTCGKGGLHGSTLRFRRLVKKDEVAEAKVERARRIFISSLRKYREEMEEEIEDGRREGYVSMEEARGRRDRLREETARIEETLYEVEDALIKAPRRWGTFVFFGQRISPTGAPRIAYINEGLLAYAGPSFSLEKYVKEGSLRIRATPSLAALKYVDYWVEALPLFIYEVEGGYDIDYEDLEAAIRHMAPYWALNIEDALREGRRKPTLNIVTTQSYNMTNLIKFWLEEEMANFNTIKFFNLEGEVARLVEEYKKRIVRYGEKVIGERSLDGALALELSRGVSRDEAILNIIAKDRDVARDVANLALIVENRLEGEVLRRAEGGGQPLRLIREQVLKSYKIDPKSLEVVKAEGLAEDDVTLYKMAKRYLRDHLDLAESTARKEVIVKHRLLREVDKHRYEATGPNKKYNLAYTPSRVDLGPGEIASVNEQGQPIGPFDLEAGRATVALYEKINISLEGPYLHLNPAGAEGQKALENASRDDNYAFANLVALTAEAMGSNAYSIIAYINMRPTHLILWPGRGYGGFCIPKDGLFVNFVLSLRDKDVLRKLGIPEALHGKVIEVVDEVLEARPKYEDKLEWQEVAIGRLGMYLDLLERRGLFLGFMDQVAQVVGGFRGAATGWGRYLREAARLLYEARYTPSRLVNNFMPYHAAAHIYHALDIARARNLKVCEDKEAKVGLQASYKPGVQDSRLSTEFDVFLALVKDEDRLGRVGFEGLRKLVGMSLDERDVPAEVRLIDPLIDAEYWMFEEGLSLKDKAEEVKELLIENVEGLDESMIKANIEAFKADLKSWLAPSKEGEVKLEENPLAIAKLIEGSLRKHGVKDLESRVKDFGIEFSRWPEFKEKPKLIKLLENKIRGKAQWLIAYMKGIEKDVEAGVEGLDVLSLGVPHRPIAELVQDLPRLSFLMKKGNLNSALALVDGAAGARGLVMDKDMVKEWLSLGGTYVAIGVSDEAINLWREEMEEERDRAGRLLEAIMQGRYGEAQLILNEATASISEEYFEEVQSLKEGRELGQDSKELGFTLAKYGLMEEVLDRAASGLKVSELDFGTFLLLGGRFLLLSHINRFKNYEDFEDYVKQVRAEFERKVRMALKEVC